jgi:hypothetical protein
LSAHLAVDHADAGDECGGERSDAEEFDEVSRCEESGDEVADGVEAGLEFASGGADGVLQWSADGVAESAEDIAERGFEWCGEAGDFAGDGAGFAADFGERAGEGVAVEGHGFADGFVEQWFCFVADGGDGAAEW